MKKKVITGSVPLHVTHVTKAILTLCHACNACRFPFYFVATKPFRNFSVKKGAKILYQICPSILKWGQNIEKSDTSFIKF